MTLTTHPPAVHESGWQRGLACLALCLGTGAAHAITVYDPGNLSFSTTGQSMWDTGAATQFANSRFVGAQWTNKSASVGGITGGVTSVTAPSNPAWYAWKGCDEVSPWCPGEPDKWPLTTVFDTRTGARVDLTSSGKFGLEFGYSVDSGSVNASAAYSARAVLPSARPRSGEYFSLNPSAALNGGSISSQSPKVEAHVNAIAQMSGFITASGCLPPHGCASGSANLPSVNANMPILSIDPNGLQVLPRLLPGPTPSDPRQPLAQVDLLNQELTLKGALSPELVPGFQLTTSQFTLVNTIPPGPAVSVDLASIEFKVPDIATSGGLQGGTIKSSGRDDVIQARVDLDGVAVMGGLPILGAGLELVDSGGFKIEAQLDAIDIDAGPDIGITQDFELVPTLMAHLDFSSPTFIDGYNGLQSFWEGAWDTLPDIALSATTTITPTYWLDAMLTNTLGIDLGLIGTMDLFKLGVTASAFGVDLLDTSPISLNSLLGIGNELFSTDKLQFPIYSTPFMLGGFSPIEAAPFTIQMAMVPEPSTWALLAIGLFAIGGVRKLGHGRALRGPTVQRLQWCVAETSPAHAIRHLGRASASIRASAPCRKDLMQVFLNTDPHTDGRDQMAAHLKSVVQGALGRFGEQLTRVEAHLADANSGSKTHPDEIQCTLEARLVGLDPVVVKEQSSSAHQAIQGAVTKLQRAITTALAKHELRRTPAPSADPEA